MKIKIASEFTQLTRIALAALVGVGTIALFSQPTIAQTAESETVNPLEDFQNPDKTADPFSDRGTGQSGVYDLIHRAILGNGRSAEEFRSDQQESLNDAASEFRKQQLERLNREGQPPQTTETVPTSETGNSVELR